MGAAAAVLVAAADKRIDALVLDSCYMSIESVAYDVAKKLVSPDFTPSPDIVGIPRFHVVGIPRFHIQP